MRVIDNNNTNKITYDETQAGLLFEFEGSFYIAGEDRESTNVKTGCSYSFNYSDMVTVYPNAVIILNPTEEEEEEGE